MWLHTEHTGVVTYGTVYTQTSLIWWSLKSWGSAVNFGYFRYSTGREEERGYHFSILYLISASTHTISVWHNQAVARNTRLGAWKMCFSQEHQFNKIQFCLWAQSLSYPLTILLHDYHDAAQVFTASSCVFVKFQLDSHERNTEFAEPCPSAL